MNPDIDYDPDSGEPIEPCDACHDGFVPWCREGCDLWQSWKMEYENWRSTVWSCPWCGCEETWFDRTISYLPDGTEDGMKIRCAKCGRATDDLPNAANQARSELEGQ